MTESVLEHSAIPFYENLIWSLYNSREKEGERERDKRPESSNGNGSESPGTILDGLPKAGAEGKALLPG